VADDDATTDDAQGGADGGGDDQGSSSASGTQDGAGTGDQPSAADLKAALDEIRELRRENAKRRTHERDLEQQLAAAQEADMSEQQKLEQKVQRLEAELAARDARDAEAARKAAIVQAATAQKAVDPDLVADLLAPQLTEEDADIPAAVKALLESKSYLRAGPPPSGGDAQGSVSASDAARSGDGEESDDARRARIYGGDGDMFDPKLAQKMGGGVVVSSPDKVMR